MKYSKKVSKIFSPNFIYLFLFFITIGLLIFAPLSLNQVALALQGRYNRAATDNSIGVVDWNYLDDDFLARDGSGAMTGDLNMGGNQVTNVGAPSNNTDAATVGYVNDSVSTAVSNGGSTFVNWGREDCPASTDLLYGGIAFSANYDAFAGGGNPVCIIPGDAGSVFGTMYSDQLYPLRTGDGTFPTDGTSPILSNRIIKCAVCMRRPGACYTVFGSHDCNTTEGFNPLYAGYILGSRTSNNTAAGYPHNPTQRACVNSTFDGELVRPATDPGALWYAARIIENYGVLPQSEDSYIKCAICCS